VLGAITLVIVLIGQSVDEPRSVALQRAAVGVLGEEGRLTLVSADEDPPDAESAALARGASGVVELSWGEGDGIARLHCYMARDERWVDREIRFGAEGDGSRADAVQRGRLIGFAVASMFAADREVEPAAPAAPPPAPGSARPPQPSPPPDARPESVSVPANRALEIAGVLSAGVGGPGAGFGAGAGFRARLHGGWWGRLAISGRGGSIPAAQATTRSLSLSGGVAWMALDASSSPWVLGARLDAGASYFEASHLSEDDVEPDRRSRWLPGASLMAELGFKLTESTGLFTALGPEVMLGKTEIYTHGNRVAVVPPLRAAFELGFRAGF
jgi:hypothetical protein